MQKFEKDVRQDMEETRFLVYRCEEVLISEFCELKDIVKDHTFINMHISEGLMGDDLFFTQFHIVDANELQGMLNREFTLKRVGTFDELYSAV